MFGARPLLALNVISWQCSITAAFGEKRTLSKIHAYSVPVTTIRQAGSAESTNQIAPHYRRCLMECESPRGDKFSDSQSEYNEKGGGDRKRSRNGRHQPTLEITRSSPLGPQGRTGHLFPLTFRVLPGF
jgi:hypothetical protein